MGYKYETHLHTSEGSKCGTADGASMARVYKEIGYSGIFVTDHFLNGNTTVPFDLPWDEKINFYCNGYQNAYEEGQKIGIDVFFGFEYQIGPMHLLTYGLDRDWLLNYPEMLSWDIKKYCDTVHADGGFIVHAHPFRQAPYLSYIALIPNYADAVEVINTAQNERFNYRAEFYAKEYNLPETSGSDIHSANLSKIGGIESETRLSSVKDYINLLKSGAGYKLLGGNFNG